MAASNGIEQNSPRVQGDADTAREEVRTLEDVRLGIGDALHLQSQAGDNGDIRYTVRLIGYLRGKGLIVTTPMQDGKFLLMREGQSFVVRLFLGKSAYAFPASIFKVANVPYPHLHLTWPNKVTGLTVRSGARARVNLIAAITDARGRPLAGAIDDLSIGGCSVSSREIIGRRDDRIRLTFRANIHDIEQYFQLDGVVRSVQPNAEYAGEPANQHGIQFVKVPQQDQLALTAYVYQKLIEESARA